jgi:hypothetical protein
MSDGKFQKNSLRDSFDNSPGCTLRGWLANLKLQLQRIFPNTIMRSYLSNMVSEISTPLARNLFRNLGRRPVAFKLPCAVPFLIPV